MFRLELHGITADEEIRSAIKNYGYDMRNILVGGGLTNVHNRIQSRLTELDLMTVQKMLEADINNVTESHTLITSLCTLQPGPTNIEYLKSDTISRTLAGAVVYKTLLSHYGAEFHRKIRFTASLYGRVGGAAAAGGGLWEMWCHQEIPKLKRLNLIEMVVKQRKLVRSEDTISISIGRLTQQIYTSKDTMECTTNPMKYYIPAEKNNPTFDAFCRSPEKRRKKGIGLQMTLATTHPVAPSGLARLQELLSADKITKDLYFVFVIPKGQRFECAAPERESVWTFCILELDDGKFYW